MTRKQIRRRPRSEPQISAAEFKAKCLSLMDEVAHKKQSITVTKRGKPIARLVPVEKEEQAPFIGFLRGCVLKADRIDEPTGEVWDAETR
jgi:prevent-host-death family protein